MNLRDKAARFAVGVLDMSGGPESFRGKARLKAAKTVSEMTPQDLTSLGISSAAQRLFLETIQPRKA